MTSGGTQQKKNVSRRWMEDSQEARTQKENNGFEWKNLYFPYQ